MTTGIATIFLVAVASNSDVVNSMDVAQEKDDRGKVKRASSRDSCLPLRKG